MFDSGAIPDLSSGCTPGNAKRISINKFIIVQYMYLYVPCLSHDSLPGIFRLTRLFVQEISLE